jgi:hypothetical protein
MKNLIKNILNRSSKNKKLKRKRTFIALATIVLPICLLLYLFVFNQESKYHLVRVSSSFDLKPGDILFQDLDCGDTCDAIEAVTEGVDGADLSHIAVVSHVDDNTKQVYLIESLGNGVQEITIDKFLGRSFDDKKRPKVLVGRLNDFSEHELDKVVQRIRSFIGKPYDNLFNVGDDKYYCSELVHEVFRKGYKSDSEAGKPLFKMEKMTFNDPKDGKIMPVWKDYFGKLGSPIPEGKPGINPGSISRSKHITIMHGYGCPDGWSGCPN